MAISTATALPDIFFLPEWGRVYEQQDGGQSRTFELKNDYGHVFYQFVQRPIPLGDHSFYDTITPFGLSGPVILDCLPGKKAELAATFDRAFQAYCEENRIVAEYIRFNSWLGNIEDFGHLYGIDKRGITMYIDLTVEDVFMNEFRSGARQQVRRALKNGVEIEYDFTGEKVSEFYRLYTIMAKKNDITDYYRFSEELLAASFESLKGKQFIVFAKHKGTYISAGLFVHHGEYLHYHLAANDPAFFHLAGNSFVLYEGSRWGVEHGKKELHLGGASTEPLYRFKKGFTKTEPLDILTGKRVRNEEVYKQLVEEKCKENSETDLSFFPAYRG